jgi:hypothetical protein
MKIQNQSTSNYATLALAALAIICAFGAHPAFAQCNASLFVGGTGTETNPYQISTAEQLQNLNNCLGYGYQNNYVLNNDIDLTSYLDGDGNNDGEGWQPIGNSDSPFRSKFNGNGHKVSGLWINRPLQNYVGLFSYISSAEIKNIGVEIDNGKGGVIGNSSVGGLVGSIGSGTISNSYATGSVTGTGGYVGGLVGSNSYGTISSSYATGSVTGNDMVGGLVGVGSGGIISYSYYDKETSGQTDTGKGIGKSTAEMKTQGTYEGWDFEGIWETNPVRNSGYPSLFWQNSEHLGNAIISAIPNQTWTGNPMTPKPSNVSFKGNNLTEGTDFEYSYDNIVQTGTAILRIVGKGAYLGQAKIVEFSIVAATCGTGFAGGTGTEEDPYKIADAKSLDAIGNCLNYDYHYELQNDIDLGDYIANSSAGWKPIGSNLTDYGYYSFKGKFNGNGHKVSGLWIDRPSDYVGLFGYVYFGAEIRNIGVEIDNGKGGVRGNSYVGGLVGGTNNRYSIGGSVTISNSYATGSVTGNNSVGGLVGNGWSSSTISSSYATGSVTGNSSVGGLAGSGGTISNSYATGSVTGDDRVGG